MRAASKESQKIRCLFFHILSINSTYAYQRIEIIVDADLISIQFVLILFTQFGSEEQVYNLNHKISYNSKMLVLDSD